MTYTPIPQGTPNWDVPVNAAFASQDSRITANEASIAANTASIAANRTSTFEASDHGLIAWTMDPGGIPSSATSLTAGQMYFSKVKVPNATTVSNVVYNLTNAGVGTTAGQCFVGVYDASGNRIALSGDQATNFTGAAGIRTAPVGPMSVSAGLYYVAFLSNSSGAGPQITGSSTGGSVAATNINLTAANGRSITTSTGNTSLPATIAFGSQVLNSVIRWAAIS